MSLLRNLRNLAVLVILTVGALGLTPPPRQCQPWVVGQCPVTPQARGRPCATQPRNRFPPGGIYTVLRFLVSCRTREEEPWPSSR